MQLQRISLTALITLLAAVSIPFPFNFPAPLRAPQALAQTPDARKVEADRLNQQGIEQAQTSQFEAALQSWQQALTIYREIKDRYGEGAALGNLGVAYFSLGDYSRAIDYYEQNLAIARKIKDRQGEGNALGSLGNAYYSLGDYSRAIEYQEQHLAIAREIKDRPSEGTDLNNLGAALYKQGKFAAAEKTLRDGIQVWESLRAGLGSNDANKVSIFEEQVRTYRTLQQVLIAQNKSDAALEIAERGRARAFVELLTRRLSPNPTEQATITPPTLEQIKQIAKAQNSTLVQYSIVYDNVQVEGKQQTKESELYIWVIKPTGEVTFRFVDLKPLSQQQNTSLENLVSSILGSSPHSWGKPLKQLHQILIQPIADLLPTDPNARVVFIPQASLFQVPFGALQDAHDKYLIEKHTILTAPSIQVLELTRQQRQKVKKAAFKDTFVLGNPTMPTVSRKIGEPPQQLNSLPGSEAEAKAIAPLFNTQAIIGNKATKAAVKQQLPSARIIHLATHGLADDVRGLGSWIALAPSGKDNGLLTAEEILEELNLNAELVVMSACQTGKGRITGDGIIGLSRSWISAGVSNVVVSLWFVPDDATQLLMTQFYENMRQNPDKAVALRKAMLTTMKQHSLPRNWAAFTLIGEAE